MLFRTPPHINSLLSHLNMTFLNKGERSTKPASCICFCLALGKPALRESRSGYLPDFVKSASGPCKAGGELTTQVLCGCSHRGDPHLRPNRSGDMSGTIPCTVPRRSWDSPPSPKWVTRLWSGGHAAHPWPSLGSREPTGAPRAPQREAELDCGQAVQGLPVGLSCWPQKCSPFILTPFFEIKPVKVGEPCG